MRGVHYNTQSNTSRNELMENIAKFCNLLSLSLCACQLESSFPPAKNVLQEKKTLGGSLLQKNIKRFAHGRNMQCRLVHGKEVSRNEGCCSNSVQTNRLSSFVGTFAHLTKSCSKITEFELIHLSPPGFSYFAAKPIYYEQQRRYVFNLPQHS